MKLPPLLALLLLLCCGVGCGKEIGDECFTSTDCSPNGDRQCDQASKDGYCTVQGCDFDTCPEEAVCVRFFTGSFTNKACVRNSPSGTSDDCSLDELCSLVGFCVPRSSEIRFCMRKCDGGDDCRDGYECRNEQLMKDHGGEPVTDNRLEEELSSFCASAPPEPAEPSAP